MILSQKSSATIVRACVYDCVYDCVCVFVRARALVRAHPRARAWNIHQ